ncbi:uncharacterized protein V1516DRAFT_687992 [Lipomyces oligophaga]|uniref:uncharacterized protein n=1 Tax=Lipomyces oligophaga TaxID=45792 RepID=UPI0034CDDF37
MARLIWARFLRYLILTGLACLLILFLRPAVPSVNEFYSKSNGFLPFDYELEIDEHLDSLVALSRPRAKLADHGIIEDDEHRAKAAAIDREIEQHLIWHNSQETQEPVESELRQKNAHDSISDHRESAEYFLENFHDLLDQARLDSHTVDNYMVTHR